MAKRYTDDFKFQAVQQYQNGASATALCQQLGIARSTLFLNDPTQSEQIAVSCSDWVGSFKYSWQAGRVSACFYEKQQKQNDHRCRFCSDTVEKAQSPAKFG